MNRERLGRQIKGEIVGHGDIARALMEIDLQDKLYFASGVSNSQETKEDEYQREKDLLLGQDRSKHLVYFSSLAVFYGKTRYVEHKKEMETLIKENFPHYCIVRLGNITWGNNPHTLINALKARVAGGEPLKIEDTTRYLLDKREFQHWINLIPNWNCEFNMTGRPMKVAQIVKEYVL